MAKKKKKSLVPQKQPRRHAPSMDLACELLSKGYSRDEAKKQVTELRKTLKLSVTEAYVEQIISDAGIELSKEYTKDKGELIAIHVERYNRDIESILATENIFEEGAENELKLAALDWKQENVLKERLIAMYYNALSTMFNKESVLQMHSRGFQVFITNTLNIDIEEESKKKVSYDLSTLSVSEKIDFLNLVLKSKKNDFEVGSVILKDTNKDKEGIVDIPYEMVEDVPNVAQIKHEELPIKPIVRDNRALINLNEKLAETFRKRAEETFKKAGSKEK